MKKQVLFFVMMLMPLMASAVLIDGICYNLNTEQKTASVTFTGGLFIGSPFPGYDPITTHTSSYSDSITIPSKVLYDGEFFDVTSIGDLAFSRCSNLTSVTIPNSVTSIGKNAFQICRKLTSITIPSSVTTIGEGAFRFCDSISTITTYCNPTSIGGNVFLECNSLNKVIIDNEEVAPLFKGVKSIKEVVFSDIVKNIKDNAFYGCSGLPSVTIPNNVRTIGSYAFYNCSGLSSVTIPNNVKTIGSYAFYGCSTLNSMTIGNSVTSIGSYAFNNCSGISSVTIPNNVKSIGAYAFNGCSSLTSITFGNSVTSIGNNAFKGCSNLKSVFIDNMQTWCKNTFSNFESNPLHYANHLFLNNEEVKDLVIPKGVERIGKYTFYDCNNLTSVVIPNSVTSIGLDAFSGCSALTSVYIDDIAAWCKILFPNVESNPLHYANQLFLNDEEVRDLVIPDSVTSINNFAFSECSSISSLDILNGVTSIGDYAFYKCIGLTSVKISNSITNIGNYAFFNCNELLSVSIGNGIREIGQKAFAECPKFREAYCYSESVPTTSSDVFDNSYYVKWGTLYVPEVVIDLYKKSTWSQFGTINPLTDEIAFVDDVVKALCVANWDTNHNGKLNEEEAAAVTYLGSVFKNNTDIISFDELNFFTGLTSIGDSAFYYCSNLASITIPDNVNTIGNRAFYVCSSLKSLHLPASVTSLEDRAFAYCSGLETIEVNDGNTVYDSRDNCNALIESSSNTLLVGCKNTTIPSSVKVVAEGAFRGCAELTNIEIPEGVTTIGASAFRGCTGLISVTLPSTIMNIGTYAFSAVDDVYNLTSVTVGMTTPVAITANVFPNRANSTLYVPKGSKATYKAANYWKEFKNIVELDNGIPIKCEKPTITILANGKIKVESATEGATCVTNVTASNAEPLTDGEISLNTPLIDYTVTSYATKEGYDDSEVATATFRYEKTEGDMNGDGMLNITDVIHLVNMILGQ